MPSLLLEIGCEELPASACRAALNEVPHVLMRVLPLGRPDEVFVTPRRIAVLMHNIPEQFPEEVFRGPPERVAYDNEGRPTKPLEGFIRKVGVDVASLERYEGHVWARLPGPPLAEALPERIRQFVQGLASVMDRRMRWDDSGLQFPRPIRWVCAKLDDTTVQGFSGNSHGRRFVSGEVTIPTALAYVDTLRQAGVEPDQIVRKRTIVQGLDALGEWRDPAGKLEEVVYMVEQPTVLEGRFDERLLSLPEIVIVTAMQSHQRYFPLGGARFAFVAGGGDPDVVRAGNERVLENRLEDAAFTFERDIKSGIDELAKEIASITFAAGAGSFADKTERLVGLVDKLGGGEGSREAARLAKADQAAELVREFPDLEGSIGAEYARLAGYPEAVAAAIEEQYLPDASGGPLPQTEGGRLLAAADKVDNLTVAFALGRRPTGSRDPFGLRRAAIGLCRLATEAGLRIDLSELVSLNERALAEQGADLKAAESIAPEVADFVAERLEGLLEVPVEFVRAARGADVHELGAVARLAQALAGLEPERLERLHTVYSRADRIVAKSPDQDLGAFRPELLVEPAEQALFQTQDEVQAAMSSAQSFDEAIAAAEMLAQPLERYFEDVLVMDEDADVRRNRLRQLLDVRDLLAGALGDFNQISI